MTLNEIFILSYRCLCAVGVTIHTYIWHIRSIQRICRSKKGTTPTTTTKIKANIALGYYHFYVYFLCTMLLYVRNVMYYYHYVYIETLRTYSEKIQMMGCMHHHTFIFHTMMCTTTASVDEMRNVSYFRM